MALYSEREFDKFFEPYSDRVEAFYEAAFWRLSDELIKELMRKHMHFHAGQSVLDVGGGTARWAIWLAQEFGVNVTVIDKSRHMIAVAERNVFEAATDKVELLHGDVSEQAVLGDRTFDAVVSTYGVLSFLDDVESAMLEIERVLRPGGRAFLMGHSYANAIQSKLSRDGVSLIDLDNLVKNHIVRWGEHVPPLRVFSSETFRAYAENANLRYLRSFGLPVLAYPGAEDFGYPYEHPSVISRALEDDDYFDAVLELEIQASSREDWVERGVNIALYAEKPVR